MSLPQVIHVKRKRGEEQPAYLKLEGGSTMSIRKRARIDDFVYEARAPAAARSPSPPRKPEIRVTTEEDDKKKAYRGDAKGDRKRRASGSSPASVPKAQQLTAPKRYRLSRWDLDTPPTSHELEVGRVRRAVFVESRKKKSPAVTETAATAVPHSQRSEVPREQTELATAQSAIDLDIATKITDEAAAIAARTVDQQQSATGERKYKRPGIAKHLPPSRSKGDLRATSGAGTTEDANRKPATSAVIEYPPLPVRGPDEDKYNAECTEWTLKVLALERQEQEARQAKEREKEAEAKLSRTTTQQQQQQQQQQPASQRPKQLFKPRTPPKKAKPPSPQLPSPAQPPQAPEDMVINGNGAAAEEEDEESDGDYVIDTYYRVPAKQLARAQARSHVPDHHIGVIELDNDGPEIEFFFGPEAEPGSEAEFDIDEDENAENHPSADYPDEEEVDDLDDEDAWLSSIRRRQRGGDVFDEDEYGYGYDDDEIYHSDDENDDDGLAGFRKWQAARRARGY